MLNQHGLNRRYGSPGSTAHAFIRKVVDRFPNIRHITIAVGFFDWGIYSVSFVKNVVQEDFAAFRRVPRVQFKHVCDLEQDKHKHVFEQALRELSLEFTASAGEDEKPRRLRIAASTPVLIDPRTRYTRRF